LVAAPFQAVALGAGFLGLLLAERLCSFGAAAELEVGSNTKDGENKKTTPSIFIT
jgi:hypothetical protein